MSRLWEQEWVSTALMALILIGIGLLVIGGVTFFTAQYDTGRILAERVEIQRLAAEAGQAARDTYAQMLFGRDQQLVRLESDLNRGIIMSGAGLILIALGWIGREVRKSRRVSTAVPRP
ncbi:MAG: hypothetical protein SF162_00135 [bacterium]|nr:hypothetical protein [bacterium]